MENATCYRGFIFGENNFTWVSEDVEIYDVTESQGVRFIGYLRGRFSFLYFERGDVLMS